MSNTEPPHTRGLAHLVGHVAEGRPATVYVGRSNLSRDLPGSIFANPFRLETYSRAEALRRYVDHALASGAILAGLPDLRGKKLDCWCRRSDAVRTPENTCHADVLVALLVRLSNAEIHALRDGATGQGTFLALGGARISVIDAKQVATYTRAMLGV